MKFQNLIERVGDGPPLFTTGQLLAGNRRPAYVRQQLSRWVGAGKVIQIKRGLYMLEKPWRRERPHAYLVANWLAPCSWVSGESVLSDRGIIPDIAWHASSYGPIRSRQVQTPVGHFFFQRLTPRLNFGYRRIEVFPGQFALVAEPEKALVDMAFGHPDADNKHWVRELRLNYADLDLDKLDAFVARARSRKLERMGKHVRNFAADEEFEDFLR